MLSKQFQLLASQPINSRHQLPSGSSGAPSAVNSIQPPTSPILWTQTLLCKSLPITTEMASWLPVGLWYVLKQWKVPFVPLGRHSHYWDTTTHNSCQSGNLDLHLGQQLKAYSKQDPTPACVKPIPFPILAQTITLWCCANTPAAHAITDMLLLGFFFSPSPW